MKILIRDLHQLNALIARNGYSKRQFSEIAGISAPMLVQITNGIRNPSPPTAKRIADALSVGWDELFEIHMEAVAQ